LGHVSRPRGLRGEFFLDSPVQHDLEPGTLVLVILKDGTQSEHTLSAFSRHSGRVILRIAGVDTIEGAEAMRDAEVAVERGALGDELLIGDLIGFSVVEEATGREIGIVKDWHENPGNDLLELESGALLPYVSAFFPRVERESRKLFSRLPEGLEEL
jgi:16S rRNA processing protein RimM